MQKKSTIRNDIVGKQISEQLQGDQRQTRIFGSEKNTIEEDQPKNDYFCHL